MSMFLFHPIDTIFYFDLQQLKHSHRVFVYLFILEIEKQKIFNNHT